MRAAVLAVAAGLSLGLAACGNESDQVFDRDGFPFTFEYPEGFEETDDVEIAQPVGAQAVENAAVGLDDHDLIALQRFTLQLEVSESNLDAVSREVDALLRQVDPQAKPAEPGELAGFPTLSVDGVTISSVEGALSDITFLFEGNQEYVINCQSTPDHREEITEACGLAVETLTPK